MEKRDVSAKVLNMVRYSCCSDVYERDAGVRGSFFEIKFCVRAANGKQTWSM